MSLWSALGERLGNRRIFRVMSVYPPYLGAGVRVAHVSEDVTRFDIEMKLRPWNRNFVGTQFGGSLYSMCDPWFMLILFEHLGRDHVVWDKAASIEFLKPGRGRVRATFEVTPPRIAEIRAQAAGGAKVEPEFDVDVIDDAGEVVARVHKRMHVRRKRESVTG